MPSPKNVDYIFKCPSIYINFATKLIYINQTNHQKKVCDILMLPFGFNFLLEDAEFCSKEGLKLQL